MSTALELWRAVERWNPLQKRAADGTWGDGAGRLLGDQGVVYMGRNDDGGFNLGIGSVAFRGRGNVDEDDDSGDVFGHTAQLSPAAARELHARLTAAAAEGKRRQAAADAQWDEHGTVPDSSGDFVIASGYVSGDGADVHYSVELDDYDVGVQTYLAAIPHTSDATLEDLWGAEQAAVFDPKETARLLGRLGGMVGTVESVALNLWRALEARHNLRGPDGRFISAGGGGGSSGRPSLADAVRGTAAGGPKRQRDGKGGMSVADAVRAAARDSDSTGRPTQRTPGQQRPDGARRTQAEVEQTLAEQGVPASMRAGIAERIVAEDEARSKPQPKGGSSRLSEMDDRDLEQWLDTYGTDHPRSKAIMRELEKRRAAKAGLPAPPRAARASRGPVDAAGVAAKLGTATSLDEARAHLAGLSKQQLFQVAMQAGVVIGASDTKPRAIERLVNATAGRRLDAAAIDRMARR